MKCSMIQIGKPRIQLKIDGGLFSLAILIEQASIGIYFEIFLNVITYKISVFLQETTQKHNEFEILEKAVIY